MIHWWVDDMFARMDGRDTVVFTIAFLAGLGTMALIGGCL